MTHKFLDLAIKYTELDFVGMTDTSHKAQFRKYNFDFGENFIWTDTTNDSFWLQVDRCRIIKNPRMSNFLKLGTEKNTMSLSIEQYKDIKNNFIENGTVKDIEFTLAYGKGYSDQSMIISELEWLFLSEVIEILRTIYSGSSLYE